MFLPQQNQEIKIKDSLYFFDKHPVVSNMVYGQEGGRSYVFRLHDANGNYLALKVFKARHRSNTIEIVSSLLKPYQHLPGLKAVNRFIITSSELGDLVTKFPELEYSVLMPWIDGQTCLELFVQKTSVRLETSSKLARGLAYVLAELESHGLSHCDLSGGNVMVNLQTFEVQLVSIEKFFGPNFPQPILVPAGSPGYRFPQLGAMGQWESAGDRFSGAVLISVILAWAVPEIREIAWGEAFFNQSEMGQRSERYLRLYSILKELVPDISYLFREAWFANTLSECPKLNLWKKAFDE